MSREVKKRRSRRGTKSSETSSSDPADDASTQRENLRPLSEYMDAAQGVAMERAEHEFNMQLRHEQQRRDSASSLSSYLRLQHQHGHGNGVNHLYNTNTNMHMNSNTNRRTTNLNYYGDGGSGGISNINDGRSSTRRGSVGHNTSSESASGSPTSGSNSNQGPLNPRPSNASSSGNVPLAGPLPMPAPVGLNGSLPGSVPVPLQVMSTLDGLNSSPTMHSYANNNANANANNEQDATTIAFDAINRMNLSNMLLDEMQGRGQRRDSNAGQGHANVTSVPSPASRRAARLQSSIRSHSSHSSPMNLSTRMSMSPNHSNHMSPNRMNGTRPMTESRTDTIMENAIAAAIAAAGSGPNSLSQFRQSQQRSRVNSRPFHSADGQVINIDTGMGVVNIGLNEHMNASNVNAFPNVSMNLGSSSPSPMNNRNHNVNLNASMNANGAHPHGCTRTRTRNRVCPFSVGNNMGANSNNMGADSNNMGANANSMDLFPSLGNANNSSVNGNANTNSSPSRPSLFDFPNGGGLSHLSHAHSHPLSLNQLRGMNDNVRASVNVNTSLPNVNNFNLDAHDVAAQAYHAAQQHAFQFANSLWDLDERDDMDDDDPDSDDDDDDDNDDSVNLVGVTGARNFSTAVASSGTGTATTTSPSCSAATSSRASDNASPHSSPCARTSSRSNPLRISRNIDTTSTRARTCRSSNDFRVAVTAGRSSINVPTSVPAATRTANTATATRSGGASVSSMASDAAVAPSSEKRRMTRSMARAKIRSRKADASSVIDVDAEDNADTQPPAKSTRSSRKRTRSSSPDRKQSASKPATETEEDDESKKCCICLDQPSEKELSKLDGCNHSYCFACIEKWSERENTCPQCKARFLKIERVHKIKRRKSNDTSPKVANVKKVKNRDQRADYRQQNSLQGFFANMEAYGLHGLNLLFTSGPPGIFDGPGEPLLVPNMSSGGAGGGGTAAASTGPTASSIAASIGLFSPSMTRTFSASFATHANIHANRASSGTTSSANRPSAQPSRRTARFSRMAVRDVNNSWPTGPAVGGGGGGGSALNGTSNSISVNHRSLIQRVANLNRDQDRQRLLRNSRNQMPNARDAAAAAAASLAESVFDSGVAAGRGSRNRNSTWITSGVDNVLTLLDDSDDE